MSTLLNLSKRLENIVNLCDNTSVVADIGCDHGYVSAELILSNKCDRVVAVDISGRSLGKAIRFADSLNIKNYISFREGDGFNVIYKNDKVKQGIIAGMGGMEIIKILEEESYEIDLGLSFSKALNKKPLKIISSTNPTQNIVKTLNITLIGL